MARRKAGDKRLTVVTVVLLAALAIIAGKLFIIQGLEAAHYKQLASQQRDADIKVAARRGSITDREGEILAISEDCSTIYATPYLVKNKKAVASKLAPVLGEDPGDLEKKLSEKSGFVYLVRKLDKTIADRVKKMKLPGIGFVDESKRFYPLGKLASQVLGVVDIDNKGQAGLEMYYDDLLGGKPGEVILEKDAAGNPIPGSEKKQVQQVDGTASAHLGQGHPGERRGFSVERGGRVRRQGGHGRGHGLQHRRHPGDGDLAHVRPQQPRKDRPGCHAQPRDNRRLRAGLSDEDRDGGGSAPGRRGQPRHGYKRPVPAEGSRQHLQGRRAVADQAAVLLADNQPVV
jgi:hypothetical protein